MGRKRIFDPGGQHEAESFTLQLLTGEIRLYVLPADEDDSEQHDRAMCVHVFADGAESVTPGRTITHHRTGRVFRCEMCQVCKAMHMPRPDQRAENDFRNALVRIMDEPPDATG